MRDAERSLARLDLNLLVTLDALLSERNVTRAARRLNLSQPAVSVQLAKLRTILKDPLLVPGSRGMTPTSLAASLESPLRDALEQLVQVIAPARPFDPTQATLTWRVAASDYSERAVVQPLLPALRRDAPATRLSIFESVPARMSRQAELAEIDLGFITLENAPPNLRHRRLFTERYVLAGRADHPALRRRPTLAQFCRLEFAIVSPEGGGFRGAAEPALEALGLSRQVVLSVSPPAPAGTRSTGITGAQGPGRWRASGSSPCPRRMRARASSPSLREGDRESAAWCGTERVAGQEECFVERYPFPSRRKCSARSVRRSAMTCALRASGKTLGQSLKRRLVVMQVERR